MTDQKKIFMSGEGDQWFERNRTSPSTVFDDEIIQKYTSKIKTGNVLEIGCANGNKLNTYKTNLKAYGIDPSQKAIDDGKKIYPDLKLSVGTSDELNFDDGMFDVVVVGFCLYLIDRKLIFPTIMEIDRVLKPQGLLFITDFDPPYAYKRKYHHLPDQDVYSYKMNYEKPFLATNQYILVDKICVNKTKPGKAVDPHAKVSTCVLKKDTGAGFPTE